MTDNRSEKQPEIKKAAALKYNMEEDNAPKIVAKGKGKIAQKIVETAAEHDIPVKEDQDIIEVLTRLNLGDEIPEELYEVVAEILSFIYQLEEK